MKKKVVSLALVLVMLFSVLPIQTFAAAADIVTVTVVDQEGNVLENATVTATRTYRYWWTFSENLVVSNAGDGLYTYDTSSGNYSRYTQYYTISASLTGYSSVSQQVDADTRAVTITLEKEVVKDEWAVFDVYYVADGIFPDDFTGGKDAADYGPSGDNTPLVSINVNITKLKSAEYTEYVLYEENKGNAYHFAPVGHVGSDSTLTEKQKLELAKPFWDAVIECMDEASIEAFEDTGLFDTFVGYCLKNQGSTQYPDNHLDGILSVTPPVYVIEMHERNAYFGGFAHDTDTVNQTTLNHILTAYNNHYGQEVEWTDNGDNTYTGSYIEGKYKYTLQITQTNATSGTHQQINNIKYMKQTDTYYLANFDAEIIKTEQVAFTVIYTDGLDNDVFNDQVISLNSTGQSVTPFTGNVYGANDFYRQTHIHMGWILEGGDGTVLSQEDILNTYTSVNRDLTFVAVYEVAPEKFGGTVEVLLDGTYDSTTGTATGEHIDIATVKGDAISLYVRAEGSETYIPLKHTGIGIYNAELENGIYHIYYYDGMNYTLSSEQQLTINGADRTRYLFFYAVTYELNGGTKGPESLLTYHRYGRSVSVDSAVPTREGYLFLGWQDEEGNLYEAGAELTATIQKSYTLTAQWEKATDVYLNIYIQHEATRGVRNDAVGRHNIAFTVDTRETGATGDYTEIYTDAIFWDGESFFENTAFEANRLTGENSDLTIYQALQPTLTNVPLNRDYTFTTAKTGYDIVSVEQRVDADGNTILDATIIYEPEDFDLAFKVELDEEGKSRPKEMKPVAVNTKVIYWVETSWQVIGEQKYTYERIALDENGEGTGFYPVWKTNSDHLPYFYRIEIVSFELADGTLVPAENIGQENTNYNSADSRFTTVIEVTGGEDPDITDTDSLTGAWYGDEKQNGIVKAVVSIPVYDVTFIPNGGTLNGSREHTVLAEQIVIPDLSQYVPTREGGYVFDGWHVYEDGVMKDETIVTGGQLYNDITVIAKWKEPLTVEGTLTIGATYEQKNADGSITLQRLFESGRAKEAELLLQKIDANGYTETVRELQVTLDYEQEEYYYLGTREVGVAQYCFEQIPDDGTEYRIQLLIPNYVSTFQNEPASLTAQKDYPTYDLVSYKALWGENAPNTATVNIHSHFLPDEFPLEYEVYANQIGVDFRPENVEILITYDNNLGNIVPSTWPTISQMVFDGEERGNATEISEAGYGSGKDQVWISRPDGTTYYQYGIRVASTTVDGKKTVYSDAQPFTITYKDPVYYHNGSQNDKLVATLVPKTFDVNYVLNGGTLAGEYPTSHTWSYETNLAGVEPTLKGFVFQGWYLDEALTQKAEDIISPNVAEDVTLYAKWLQVMDVVDLTVIINHNQEGEEDGLAANYNKTLYAQLTSDLRIHEGNENRVYADVEGAKHAYPNGQWHTHGDKVQQDIFQVPSFYAHLSSEYDYGVNVTLDGYYVAEKKMEKVAQPDGSTLHKVTVTLQYNPELFHVNFYVQMEEHVPKELYPTSAEVKVTSWGDDPSANIGWDWTRITQHEVTTITVHIDADTGRGTGTYPVWQWYDAEAKIPYHYRMEVVQLKLSDGSTIDMSETTEDVSYDGNSYHATIETEGGAVPVISGIEETTTLEGVYGVQNGTDYHQVGTVGAVIDLDTVRFHVNNSAYEGNDIFRTYCYSGVATPENGNYYEMNEDNTISEFYEIPEFDYQTHNTYIFKGWYWDEDSQDRPVDWKEPYSGTADIYAHWIKVETVNKEEADTKQTGSDTYPGYDLVGAQIRNAALDEMAHYGNPGSGLRFITVLSEKVYAELNAIKGNEAGAEYGFVVAKSNTAKRYAGDKVGYTLQFKGENVNGVDTQTDYKYVLNMKCSGVVDHYDGEAYRLYTAVITYNNLEGNDLEAAYATDFVARPYMRYYDANGLLRTYYNNYTGTALYGGCSTSFTAVREVVAENGGGA